MAVRPASGPLPGRAGAAPELHRTVGRQSRHYRCPGMTGPGGSHDAQGCQPPGRGSQHQQRRPASPARGPGWGGSQDRGARQRRACRSRHRACGSRPPYHRPPAGTHQCPRSWQTVPGPRRSVRNQPVSRLAAAGRRVVHRRARRAICAALPGRRSWPCWLRIGAMAPQPADRHLSLRLLPPVFLPVRSGHQAQACKACSRCGGGMDVSSPGLVRPANTANGAPVAHGA